MVLSVNGLRTSERRNGHVGKDVDFGGKRNGDIDLSDNGRVIMAQRYLRKDADGNPEETPEELFRRVANFVSQGESSKISQWSDSFYDLMASMRFLPNSPTLVNAGTDKGCLSACFVVSPDDNMVSIMDVAKDAAMIEKWGGGIGFGFSKLRPKDDKIKTTHGNACGPVAVMKLYSQVGATLTQGAFRLGAHMGQLHISHPDIQEFIHCKDGDDTLSNFNISVQLSDAFMQAVIDDEMWDLINPRDEGSGPANSVVMSVRARELWDEICVSAWKTGDPGVVFIDRVWESAPNPQMGKIQSSNPCVTGDTLVYTGNGLVPIADLAGEFPTLYTDTRNGAYNSFATKVWQSGVKPVFKLMTKEGYSLKLTADHEVYTERGKVPAIELQKGDKLRLLDHKGGFGLEGSRELGMVLGWLTGDGHIDSRSAVLSFYGEDHKLGQVMSDAVQSVVAGTGERPNRYYGTNMHVTDKGRGMIASTRLRSVAADFGLREKDWHRVPDVVYRGTEAMQRAYLQALFGADGTVTDIVEKGISVRLNSSYPELLEGVQRLLLNFGIASRIYHRRSPRMQKFPDGKGGTKEYQTIDTYEVVIGRSNVGVFQDELGFLGDAKNTKLDAAIDKLSRGFHQERFLATFDSLESLGEEEVYDLTEPMTHSFIANGLTVSNCGEELLENYGNCCLGSIDLSRHVVDGEFDMVTLAETIRLAVRFLNCVIEVNSFPLEKLREVNLATRRIGLGVMGWADALVMLGIPYDSDEALGLARELSHRITQVSWDESALIAKERGTFSEYENSALPSRGIPPVRNSSVTTIAPTGTISRLAGCSSGIEPHFALAFQSNVLWEQQDKSAVKLLDAPKTLVEALHRTYGDDVETIQDVLSRMKDNPDCASAIFEVIGEDPALYRTSMEISPEAHVRMQAAWQEGVTNSISKTINLASDATAGDVAKAYMLAWQEGCKAVTVYRDGSKSMQVLETGSTKSEPQRETMSRPKSMQGVTDLVRTGHGNMYVNITFDEDSKPFEVFSTVGKAGGCDSANLEAISRLASLALRSGIEPDKVINHLSGITCCLSWDNGVPVRSAPDGIAKVLRRHAGGQEVVSTPSGTPCPDCGEELSMIEGCMSCLTCGYGKCE